jgi:hypothetical protein
VGAALGAVETIKTKRVNLALIFVELGMLALLNVKGVIREPRT